MIQRTSYQTFIESVIIAFLLTALSIFIVTQFKLSDESFNPFELFATFTAYSCTYMCVMQSRWNYVVALVCVGTYAYVFYDAQLIASFALQIYLIPTVIYGWFVWGKDRSTKKVEHVKLMMIPLYMLVVGLTYFGALVIVKYLGGDFANEDSFLLIGSVFAQFLLDRKKLETWIVWSIVNVVSIIVYYQAGLYLVTIQFVFFLLNSIVGWAMWYRSMKE